MKDIKLTIEEIKKGCEFTDGFEIKKILGGHLIIFPDKTTFGIPIHYGHQQLMWDLTYYPLFLQRIIEGINDSGYEIGIEQTWESVNVSGQAINDQSFQFYLFSNKDQAKTQAIKYILDKLK